MNLQIESLRKTTTTRQQVLDKIKSATIDELRTIVPNLPVDADKAVINTQAEAILNGRLPDEIGSLHTEALILAIGRPVILIQDGRPILTGDEINKWSDIINNADSNLGLLDSIRSIGRIETINLPGYSWLATGWMITEDLMITNRHVADVFVAKQGATYIFRSILHGAVQPSINFLAEYKRDTKSVFTISDCVYVSGPLEPDIAVFKVRFDNNAQPYQPLQLADTVAEERTDVAVIGYPAYDSRALDMASMKRVFEGVYDVKRLAPGKITEVYKNENLLKYDATTEGGSSGSPVLDLMTGKVVGIHFAGQEKIGNYCIAAPEIQRVLRSLKINRLLAVNKSAVTISDTNGLPLPELVGRNCALEEYTKIQVPSFRISGRIVCYASPDSTFAVTKRFFESARESILIGIYDFSADHMVTLVTQAIDRGVKVSLMLDIDSAAEQTLFNKLQKYGVECVPAPSCANKNISYFASSHEKVIVIDGKWTLIQSGNYSNNSIPYNDGDGIEQGFNSTGNRDMGIAIESGPMAKFFTKILRSDMTLEQSSSNNESFAGSSEIFPDTDLLLEIAPRHPDPLFPSMAFNPAGNITVQPVLSPDNYMSEILDFLRSAKHSIKIEQQYIRVNQPLIKKLLGSIPKDISVQIIIAPPIGDPTKTLAEIQALQDDYGFEARFLSRKYFVHCHNKLIIIDDEEVLISSQNWSDSAVSKNREAGLIIRDSEIAVYYSRIFNADWTMSEDSELRDGQANNELTTNISCYGQNPGKYTHLIAADVQEV